MLVVVGGGGGCWWVVLVVCSVGGGEWLYALSLLTLLFIWSVKISGR